MGIYLLGVLVCLIIFAIMIYYEGSLTARELVIFVLVSLASWATFLILCICVVFYCIDRFDWSKVVWKRRGNEFF